MAVTAKSSDPDRLRTKSAAKCAVIPSVEVFNARDATLIQSQQEGDFAISQLKQWLKDGDRPNISQLQPNS